MKKTPSRPKPGTVPPLLLTIPETATELRIGLVKVYELISDGDLEAIDIARKGSKRPHLLVPYAAIEAYIRARPRVHSATP